MELLNIVGVPIFQPKNKNYETYENHLYGSFLLIIFCWNKKFLFNMKKNQSLELYRNAYVFSLQI